MASDKEIRRTILESVQFLFKTDRDGTSVNKVRRMAEEKLGLEDGFLKEGDWKGKSKEIITTEVEKLDEEPEPAKPAPATKLAPKSKAALGKKAAKSESEKARGTKRAAPSKAPPKKRQKKDVTPSSEDEELSELDSEEEASFEDSEESERKAKKRAIGRGITASKKVSKYNIGNEEESELSSMANTPSQSDSDISQVPKLKRARKATAASKPAPKRLVKGSKKSTETIDAEVDDANLKSPAKRKSTESNKTLGSVAELPDEETKPDTSKPAAEDTDSDLSILIDEAPRRKSSTKASKSASSKPAISRSSKSTTALSPEEAEIKTLQSQLVKCGIRKIWQFELKAYGDDSRAKIQHLKRMLREAGIEGRFSEAKAKEIKEMRELREDLEVVQEGAKRWGKGGRRSEARKVESKSGSEEEIEEESEEEARPVARRAARAKADLAFLGDESESD